MIKRGIKLITPRGIGRVTDIMLMKKRGKPARYLQIQLDDKPNDDYWLFESQTKPVIEAVKVAISDAEGNTTFIALRANHNCKKLNQTLYGYTPQGLVQQIVRVILNENYKPNKN